jgi:hypothetical protein
LWSGVNAELATLRRSPDTTEFVPDSEVVCKNTEELSSLTIVPSARCHAKLPSLVEDLQDRAFDPTLSRRSKAAGSGKVPKLADKATSSWYIRTGADT